jgi:MoCo/4Fe-4S cofactor protein with predicted Tat translocation signal
MTQSQPDLATIRDQLATARGQQFWRSLDQLADAPAFRELVEREFPRGASEMEDGVTRRTFLKLMGASLALAGISACTYQPRQYIAPFDRMPEGRVPGVPLHYASTVTLGGYGAGVLVRSNDGRPTKIEGNPRHPASLGATDIYAQAEILAMYDPDRSLGVLNAGTASDWQAAAAALTAAVKAGNDGSGVRLLTGNVTSPSLAAAISSFLADYPQARWYQYEPLNRDNSVAGARLAFGRDVTTTYDLSQAAVVVALDADLFAPGPGFAAYARTFTDGRKVRKGSEAMNRLYVVEASPSTTGTMADHRLPFKADAIAMFGAALAARFGIGSTSADLEVHAADFLTTLAADLDEHRGSSVVVVGEQQPPVLHALAHAINAALGNVGSTVRYHEPVEALPTLQTAEIAALAAELNAGLVQTLIIIGGNPAFDAPGDLRFAEKLTTAATVVHLSPSINETSALATWHIPQAHTLESWGDARAFDGTVSIIQPLIEPLYGGKTAHELLAAMSGDAAAAGYDLLRSYWSTRIDDAAWHDALAQGVLEGSTAATISPTLLTDAVTGATIPMPSGSLELVFRPDPSIYDGSYANNGWLQELPRPLTKLVWDNAALMSPRTAIKLLGLSIDPNGLAVADDRQRQINLEAMTKINGQVVRITYRGGAIELPIWLLPGHVEDSITVHLGYGRSQAGRVGDGVGVNIYPIRTSDAMWFGSGVEVTNTGRTALLVSTQDHWTLEGRDIYRVGAFEKFKQDPKYIAKEVYLEEYGRETSDYLSLQPGDDYAGRNAWGLTFNLNACVGCNACVIACQAENNIPIVGKAQVAVGREMHWIRIDRYFAGDDLDNPSTYMMPVTCMQCEKAPCELVCPVAATVHDYEGINNMVYNRCVGTKYCSNNCPYKVRRFNFMQYSDIDTASRKLGYNPDVTVRNRGVMEKCTYCVQRISGARIAAKREAVAAGSSTYTIADGVIKTACEQACPTGAITFGDINDSASRVAQWKAEPHNYGLLGFLNTKPRTTYLARVRNPNEELEKVEG